MRGHPTQGTRGELPALLLGWGGTGGARSPSQKGKAAVLGLLSLSLRVSQYGRPIAKQLLLLSCRRATERARGGAGLSSRVGKAGWKRLRLKNSIQQPRARALPAAPSPSLSAGDPSPGHAEAPKCCRAAAVCSGPALCWEKRPAERLTCFFFCSLTFPDPAGCAACAPPPDVLQWTEFVGRNLFIIKQSRRGRSCRLFCQGRGSSINPQGLQPTGSAGPCSLHVPWQRGCCTSGTSTSHGGSRVLRWSGKRFCPEVKHLVHITLTAGFRAELTCDKNSPSC